MEKGPQGINEIELLKKLNTFLELEGYGVSLRSDGAYSTVAGLSHEVFQRLMMLDSFTKEEINHIRHQASRP